jgi:hypothetical protein
MEIIIRRLAKRTPNVLPSESTVRRAAQSAAVLSSKHIIALLEQTVQMDDTATLLTDETTKKGEKYQVKHLLHFEA